MKRTILICLVAALLVFGAIGVAVALNYASSHRNSVFTDAYFENMQSVCLASSVASFRTLTGSDAEKVADYLKGLDLMKITTARVPTQVAPGPNGYMLGGTEYLVITYNDGRSVSVAFAGDLLSLSDEESYVSEGFRKNLFATFGFDFSEE